MTIAAVMDLIESLRQSRLLEPQQMEEVAALQDRFSDPRELARHLIKQGVITPYQMNQLFLGKAQDLVLGQYVLLERLGEGGMGQVFKARHQRLDRIVALKVIRKEKLDNPTAVRRFQREIRAAAKLVHPNIVMAFDADQVGQTHFFAMEYVEGIDLQRMVKDSGPLPVAQACEYARQAACGLQHAYENGLVHRDVKPANLLVEKVPERGPRSMDQTIDDGSPSSGKLSAARLEYGRVKILDMGLALVGTMGEKTDEVSRLTQEGTVMGTPDYIAPEQAMNSSTADVRADLYSLGCSFYFTLTGHAPFPGGTLMEKLIRHRSDRPEPLGRYRPDVPPKVLAIVDRLLAKKPEDRFQTPGALVQALDAVIKEGLPAGRPTIKVPDLADVGRQPAASRWRGLRLVAIGGVALAILGFVLLACVVLVVAARNKAGRAKATADKGSDKAPPPVEKDAPPNRKITPSVLDKLNLGGRRPENVPAECVALLGGGQDRQQYTCLGFSPDGKWLAAGAQDGGHVWALDGLQARPLEARGGGRPVAAVAFAPDSSQLATVSNDRTLTLWELGRRFSPQATKEVDAYEVDAVAYSPSGKAVATAGAEHAIRYWAVPGLGNVVQYKGHDGPVNTLAFNPKGRYLASGSRDMTVRLWDLSGNQTTPVGTWKDHSGEVLAVAYSPDGTRLASAARDKMIYLARFEGAERRALVPLVQHTDWFNALAFSPDGVLLAAAGQDGQLQIWDVTGKKLSRSWALTAPVRGVSFAPDGRHLAVTDGTGRILILRLATVAP